MHGGPSRDVGRMLLGGETFLTMTLSGRVFGRKLRKKIREVVDRSLKVGTGTGGEAENRRDVHIISDVTDLRTETYGGTAWGKRV